MQMSFSLGGGPPPSSTGINNFCQVNQQGGTFSSKLMCHLFIWTRWDAYFAKLPCWTHSFACPSSTTVTLMAVENEVGKGGRREEAVGKVGRDGRWWDRGAVAGESHWSHWRTCQNRRFSLYVLSNTMISSFWKPGFALPSNLPTKLHLSSGFWYNIVDSCRIIWHQWTAIIKNYFISEDRNVSGCHFFDDLPGRSVLEKLMWHIGWRKQDPALPLRSHPLQVLLRMQRVFLHLTLMPSLPLWPKMNLKILPAHLSCETKKIVDGRLKGWTSCKK